MTCRELIEFLWRYLEGDVSRSERFGFDAHLAICPDCIAYLQTYECAVRLGREAFDDPDAPLPDDVPEELIQAVLAARGPSRK